MVGASVADRQVLVLLWCGRPGQEVEVVEVVVEDGGCGRVVMHQGHGGQWTGWQQWMVVCEINGVTS